MYPEKLQLVSLFVEDLKNQDHIREVEYSVRIIDIKEDTLMTDIPLDAKGYPKSLPPGEKIRVGYAVSGQYYTFYTDVVNILSEQVPVLVLKKPTKEHIRKIQRRQFFRVPVMLDSLIQGLQPDEWTPGKKIELEELLRAGEPSRQKKVSLVDLSAGGLAFRTTEPFVEKGQMVVGTLDFPLKGKEHHVTYLAVVRRFFQEEETGMYFCSIEFIDMPERTRDYIMRYCMERQLELRKRG